MARSRKPHRHRQRHHDRQVEQDRRRRGGRKTLQRVENATVQGDQRDQQQIGKGDARELDRQPITARVTGEAGREHIDHCRREQQRDGKQHHLAGQQQREYAVGEQAGAMRPALRQDARIGRHEGGVEGALGEDRAEMVGQPQGNEERVSDRAGAQDRRQHDVADKAGDARQQRKTADREDAFDHLNPGRRAISIDNSYA